MSGVLSGAIMRPTGNILKFTTSGASQPGTLPGGGLSNSAYLISTTLACYLKWGAGAQTVTVADYNLYLPDGGVVEVMVGPADDSIAVIQAVGAGVLSIHEVERV